MLSSDSNLIMIFGILMAVCFIALSVWYVNRLFANKTKDILVKFILLVFTSLVSLFIVDKTIAFRIELLSKEDGRELFDLIKTLTLMIFSYYFGTRNQKSENDINE